MLEKDLMLESEMVVRLAHQLLETMRKLVEMYERLIERPPVVNNYHYYGPYNREPQVDSL